MNYLNSFRPIVTTKFGRSAVTRFNIPPFVDGSCRREPDFESPYPSITALCRTDKFAPKLNVGDKVAYITVSGVYLDVRPAHWRIIALLQVIKKFSSHQAAAKWYIESGYALPSNIMVDGNNPLPLEMTHSYPAADLRKKIGRWPDELIIKGWDQGYQQRARDFGTVLVCRAEFLDLYQPPIMMRENMVRIFGRVPGTQTPPRISNQQLSRLTAWVSAELNSINS